MIKLKKPNAIWKIKNVNLNVKSKTLNVNWNAFRKKLNVSSTRPTKNFKKNNQASFSVYKQSRCSNARLLFLTPRGLHGTTFASGKKKVMRVNRNHALIIQDDSGKTIYRSKHNTDYPASILRQLKQGHYRLIRHVPGALLMQRIIKNR